MKTKILKLVLALLIVIGSNSNVIAQLPEPGFEIDGTTAIVITDPQNDFLSPNGVTWEVVGESVTKNNTIENLETLFKLAEVNGIKVFISPHYYYKHDHGWKFEGALETLMHKINMFDRGDQLSVEGFEGSGADFLDRYKKYIEKDFVTVVGPHKVYGPEQNDLSLQLRKQKIDKVILAGMSGNLCVESHLRELLEDGFEVSVVGDATASAIIPGYDGNAAAQTNFRFIASHVYTTQELQEVLNNNKMEKEGKEQIEKLLMVYKESLNTSDVSKAVNSYTKDGVFMPSGAPTANGKEAIKGAYEYVFSQIQLNIEFFIEEVVIDNDIAFAITTSKGTTLIHATGDTVPEENRELFVFERENNEWKIARYMFNKMK